MYQNTFTPSEPRQMAAKFPGRCGACGQAIQVGDAILWSKAAGAQHVSCPARQAPQAAPKSAPQAAELPILLYPTEDTREGRMLLAGHLTATVTLFSGEHVTLSLKAKTRATDGWKNAALKDAEYLFVKAGDSKIATCYPKPAGLALKLDIRTSAAASQALRALIDHMAGVSLGDCRIQSADMCGRCGRELTDPESIDRGIGPDCWGQMTGSTHAKVWK